MKENTWETTMFVMNNKIIFALWLISMLSTPKGPKCGIKSDFLEGKRVHMQTLSLQVSLTCKSSIFALHLGCPFLIPSIPMCLSVFCTDSASVPQSQFLPQCLLLSWVLHWTFHILWKMGSCRSLSLPPSDGHEQYNYITNNAYRASHVEILTKAGRP